MQYKTITLHLLEENPQTRHIRPLMPLLDRFSADLRDSHHSWMESLTLQHPESGPAQIASEALELATKAMENRLEVEFPAESETDDTLHPENPLSLDEAMAFIRRRTPMA